MSVFEEAQAWATGDCDEATAADVMALVASKQEGVLREMFASPVEFGTAGLRAKVGPGPARINRAVIRRTTRAVGEYLTARHPDARSLPVVVGYDGRLTSRELAAETCGVLVAMGIPVRYFEEPVPTPLAAYTLRRYGSTAAVVITASHNTKEYNGYKLYAANGAQIVSPADEEIAERIKALPSAKEIECVPDVLNGSHDLAEPVSKAVVDAYFREIDALRPEQAPRRDLRIVYTPMHGVGAAFVERAFANAGFQSLVAVREQREPDGNFPTAPFPNPEEPGALDLAMEYARRNDAELVLANDPDADRLSACVPRRDGSWLQLTGNQIGLLLADYLLSRYDGDARPMVLCSIVSSPMLHAIGAHYGAHVEVTLTGFKWVWNAALDLREQRGFHFVFGFEEALGYSIEDIVRDKDGVSAALLFAELAAHESGRDSTILARLERLYRRHGLWVSLQYSVSKEGVDGLERIRAAVQKLGAQPPESVAGAPVSTVTDYRVGGERRPRWLENSLMIQLDIGELGRILVRPSGTEPKLKIYVDLRASLTEGDDVWEKERAVLAEAKRVAQTLVELVGLG